MATPLDSSPVAAPPASVRRPGLARRLALAAAAVAGILASATPAQAAPPATSAEAAELVAARGHELEAVTERFNEAREALAAQQATAQSAAAALEQATATLATAQQQVRGIARSAYTGEGLNSFQAMLTSDSADDFVDRMATLQLVAGHQNGLLEEAATATAAHGDRASRSTDREVAAATGPVVANSEAAQIAVDTALAQRGKPYVWAADGPGSFDCSGLTA